DFFSSHLNQKLPAPLSSASLNPFPFSSREKVIFSIAQSFFQLPRCDLLPLRCRGCYTDPPAFFLSVPSTRHPLSLSDIPAFGFVRRAPGNGPFFHARAEPAA